MDKIELIDYVMFEGDGLKEPGTELGVGEDVTEEKAKEFIDRELAKPVKVSKEKNEKDDVDPLAELKEELDDKNLTKLKTIAKKEDLDGYSTLNKPDLVEELAKLILDKE